MQKAIRDSKWVELAVALLVGTGGWAIIWVAGSPELSWLGFVTAGLAIPGNRARCSLRDLRRSRS